MDKLEEYLQIWWLMWFPHSRKVIANCEYITIDILIVKIHSVQ